MRRVISMAGLAVSLHADDATRWEAVDALFGLCPTASPGARLVELRFQEAAPSAPDRVADVAFSDVDLWYTDSGVVTRHHAGIVAVRDGDTIVVGGPTSANGLAKAFRRSAQHVLADTLAGHGRFALHAAVVVDDSEAVIALGDTGAGKSTLAISALRLGWSVVTDDIGWVNAPADGSVTVTGFPKPLHAPPDMLDAVPTGADPLVDDQRERLVLRGRVTADDVAHRVRGIVIVRHGATGGELMPFPSGPRLLTMLMRSYPLQGSPSRVRDFFPVAARLSRTPVAVLEHAADPAERAGRAAAMLGEAWERFGAPSPESVRQ